MLFNKEKLAILTPFLYTAYSRRPMSVLNFYFYGAGIVIAYGFLFYPALFTVTNILTVLVSVLLFQSVYESGYLLNDLWAFKTETKPTKRVENDYSLGQTVLYIVIRYSYVCLIYILLSLTFFQTEFFFGYFLYGLIALSITYLIYNFVHFININFRVILFAFLKVFTQFLPSFYIFLQLTSMEQLAFALIFIGVTCYYTYYYLAAKVLKLRPKFTIPLELEKGLFVFSLPFVVIILLSQDLSAIKVSIFFVLYILAAYMIRISIRPYKKFLDKSTQYHGKI